jgi:hypothetical protein
MKIGLLAAAALREPGLCLGEAVATRRLARWNRYSAADQRRRCLSNNFGDLAAETAMCEAESRSS